MIYQIYPRSFQDTNGDGIGDLKGIERRLDYLASLGVDAIWISPIYPSPMADFGYDVADYCGVDPRFGTLADFDDLLAQAHARGLKVLLDFVPNHTSDRHPWFVESRSSRDNPKRDWYIWRDPAPDGGPPNNWISDFGGSAWEWDEATGQYYYHAFLKEQPDLNWRNPAVQAAMYDVMRFWFDRGVDGFRIDVLWHMIKAADFPDNPPNPAYQPAMGDMHRVLQLHSTDQPEVHEIAADMRAIADSYGAEGRGERVLIGEIYLPVDRLMHYYGRERAGVHLPFNFQLVDAPWEARALATLIADYEAALPPGGWPNWVLGNHDRPRVAAKRGQAQARVAAMLLLTLRGTPTLYYGDELGLTDVAIPPAEVQDPRELREPGLGLGPRSGPHADAVGRKRECRLHHGQAVVAAQCRLADAQRRPDDGGAAVDPDALSSAAGGQARPSGAVDRRVRAAGGGGRRARLRAPAWRGASDRGAQSRRTAASPGVAGLGEPVSAALEHGRRRGDDRRRRFAAPGGRGRDPRRPVDEQHGEGH